MANGYSKQGRADTPSPGKEFETHVEADGHPHKAVEDFIEFIEAVLGIIVSSCKRLLSTDAIAKHVSQVASLAGDAAEDMIAARNKNMRARNDEDTAAWSPRATRKRRRRTCAITPGAITSSAHRAASWCASASVRPCPRA